MVLLNRSDVEYILLHLELTKQQIECLHLIRSSGGKVDPELADELRDICTAQLDISGFDENYNPNENGKILNVLIDKLYLG